jgi:hypothetical protein
MTGFGEPGTGSSAPMPIPTQAVWALGEKLGGAVAATACSTAAVPTKLAKSPIICRFLHDVRIVFSSAAQSSILE